MTPTHIFLDMDGVCVDFTGGVEMLFELPPGSLKKRGVYQLHERLGISEAELLEEVDNGAFWLDLPELPWLDELRDFLHPHRDRLYLLTSPMPHAECYRDKVVWAMRHGLVSSMGRVIITPHKHLLAKPGRLLIDDLPAHCNLWTAHGGTSLLFPAEHNGLLPEGTARTFDMVGFLKRALNRLNISL